MKARTDEGPTCVICWEHRAMLCKPGTSLRWVELWAGVHVAADDYAPGCTHVVCAGCAAANLDDVFQPHRASVKRVARVR